jgi:hypothetical protein
MAAIGTVLWIPAFAGMTEKILYSFSIVQDA